MLQCSKQTFARLFYNASSSFFLLLLFFHLTSIFLAKLFIFFGGNPFYHRTGAGYEFNDFSDEEIEEEEEELDGYYGVEEEKSHAAAAELYRRPLDDNGGTSDEGSLVDSETSKSNYSTPTTEYSDDGGVDEEEILLAEEEEEESFYDSDEADVARFGVRGDATNLPQKKKMEIRFQEQEDYLVFKPAKSHGKKLVPDGDDDGEMYGDTFTIGSTSKDSSEWRSSINCRDSVTDDPFSSSSRRSCPKWESYTVYQKYDEEMLFLDRISAQKLHETESLRSIQACPRSLSERIVHKLRTKSKRSSSEFHHNPYHELESTYVAQICLTWEALNWNYKYFQRLRASRRKFDPGCPAYVAQQFQQFQVLLQRYIENEPYEHGRRPEIYARMRSLAPKLLQVPEYRDSDEEKSEGAQGSRIPSSSFMAIMEESITTFMNFLKQDKKSNCQILADLFKRNRRRSSDATLVFHMKKQNKKKKAKLNELRRSGKCQLRRRKFGAEEEMEILMAMTDLKVVSRVLRMAEVNGEQLQWCATKMNKLSLDGKLHRDSAPLFFPAH